MNDSAKTFAQIDYYVKLVLRRRWFLILPFAISMAVGIYLAITLPRIYSASNLILVEPKSVPESFVPSLQAVDIKERINTIKEQILSRTNLEQIITDFDLFPRDDLFLEDKVGLVKRNAEVDVTKFGRGVDSFRIVYRGENPQTVSDVANALADRFISESLVLPLEKALATNRFLDVQLGDLRERLEEIEDRIQAYRRSNMGELPEELNSNLRILDRLQVQLNDKQLSLRDSRNRLGLVDTRIAALKDIRIPVESAPGSDLIPIAMPSSNSEVAPDIQALDNLRNQLQALRGRYTDKHPDVRRLVSLVEKLERDIEEKNAASIPSEYEVEDVPEGGAAAETPKPGRSSERPEVMDLRNELILQRQELMNEIQQTTQDIRDIETKIVDYQKRVENAPKREMELLALQRNYDNLQDTYKTWLERKLESDIAVSMEKKQQGQKFRVIDRAKIPRRPISPDVQKILLICLVVPLGIGGGLIFLLDLADSSVKIPQGLEENLSVPVLAVVPEFRSTKDRFRHRLNQVATSLVGLLCLGLFSILALMSQQGVEQVLALVGNMV